MIDSWMQSRSLPKAALPMFPLPVCWGRVTRPVWERDWALCTSVQKSQISFTWRASSLVSYHETDNVRFIIPVNCKRCGIPFILIVSIVLVCEEAVNASFCLRFDCLQSLTFPWDHLDRALVERVFILILNVTRGCVKGCIASGWMATVRFRDAIAPNSTPAPPL